MRTKILEISGLSASVLDGSVSGGSSPVRGARKKVLSGVNFDILQGETVVLLGPNGAGKSTIVSTIMGNPKFKVSGSIKFLGKEITRLAVDKRGKLGIFCSFQEPVAIPGISTTEMLRTVLEERTKKFVPLDDLRKDITESAKKMGENVWFSERELNVGFSGGEKKKNEILQMLILRPKLVILDEIDSGLDVDASGKISKILAEYQKETGCSYLIITHNMRVLRRLEPSRAILMRDGGVVAVSDKKLISKVERQGFQAVFKEFSKEGEK